MDSDAISPQDRDLWIRTVIGEAGSDPSATGVASVIANRVKATGQSPGQVVMARGQFEPWATRARELMSYAPTSPAYRNAAAIVDGVISGATPDPTNGATMFYAPAAQKALGRAPPSWDNGTGVQIGAHKFFGGQPVAQNASDPEGEALLRSMMKPAPAASAGPAKTDSAGNPLGPNDIVVKTPAPAADPEGEALLKSMMKAPAAAAAPTTPGSFPLGDPRNKGQIPASYMGGSVLPSPSNEAFDRTQPIQAQLRTAGNALAGYASGQVSGIPAAIAEDFNAATARNALGNKQLQAGNNWPSFPGLDPHTWEPGGVVNALAGMAGQVSSPITGTVRKIVQEPVTEATGSPQIGENAGFVANSLAGPLVGRAANALGSKFANATIGTLDPETAHRAALARDKYGIPVNAGQMAPSPAIRFGSSALNRLPFSGAGKDIAESQNAFTRAVSKTFGEDTSKITPNVMQAAKTRLGNEFNDIANNTTIRVDSQFANDIHGVMNDAESVIPGQTKPLYNQLQKIYDAIDPRTGAISGDSYQALTRKGAPLDKLMSSADPNLKFYAGQLRDKLDDVMQRSVSPNLADRLTAARSQYKAMKTVEDLAEKTPTGDISPPGLMQAVRSSYGGMAYGGGGDLGNLARIGQKFLKEPPSSGTAERALAYSTLAALGGDAWRAASGGMSGGEMLATAAGIPASLALGRGVGSALRSNWLANSLINRSLGNVAQGSRLPDAARLAITSALGGASALNKPVNALAAPNQ